MKNLYHLRLSALFSILFLTASAQLPDTCKLQIGTNLAGPADYGAEWPFVNVMKYARTWITHNHVWVSGGANDWDTGVLDQIPLDENGYPLELPVEVPGTEAPQSVRTVWANTESMKPGLYVVLYDGEGELDVWGDANLVSSEPGRLTFGLTPQGDIFALEIYSSKAGNHVRNIRVLMPGTETTYEQQPWSAQWLEKLEPFQTLRFMDWGYTNGSELVHWEDRPLPDDYTYTQKGIPYEWMIELSNMRKSDAWVCIPHAADEHFIRQMARLFRDNLDPDLRLYVEYSNEIWNWIFPQTHYCNDNGDPNVPWPERTVPFIQNALDIWTEEWAGQTDRLVRVVGVQHSWQDVSNRVVFNMTPGSFDAFSPAAYFGFSDEGYDALEDLGADATAEDVLFWARQSMLEGSYQWTKSQFEEIAQVLDIPMLYYEGGQHLTPRPFGSDQPYNDALVAAQSHPDMYLLYNEWYDSLRTFVQGDTPSLLMNFSFIGPTSGKYGSWGILQHQFTQQPPYADAPKYRAVTDNIFNCSSLVSTTQPEVPDFEAFVAPNPASGPVTVRFSEAGEYVLHIFGENGRLIRQQTLNGQAVTLPTPGSGVYFIRMKKSGRPGVVYRKVIVQK
ncbi:MAG: T9SS C-terminal target domain-containing protein [Bacteroidetes bacterium]|nr:MAG: T9SS C-terminal target domain-containing protein [Bacteroidota bacterium]